MYIHTDNNDHLRALSEQGWEMVTTIINECWDEYSTVPPSVIARLNEALAQEDNR
jgi:hypothetical protein